MSTLLAAVAAGCERGIATQVMVHLDVQPGIAASARSVEVRVFDGEGAERRFDRLAIDGGTTWPLRLPLVPEGGDAARSWLVEAAVRDARGAIVALARARGGYEGGALRSAGLCVYDGCEATACGLLEPTCLAGRGCQTCEAGSCVELPARATLEPGDVSLRCPGVTRDAAVDGPRCTPTGAEDDRERCGNAIDDDCDGFVDCADSSCAQIGCDADGGVCCDGECVDTWSRTEHCGGCGLECAMGATCVRVPAPDGSDAPGAGCDCSGGACPEGTACTDHDGVALCDCDETTCGGDRSCLGLGSDHHAYCGYP